MTAPIQVIGGGLAGSEAAWQLAQAGQKVILYEMRGVKSTPAHQTEGLAELVCSNSFRSADVNNAVGLLHAEMRMFNSLIMRCADDNRVPAGSALAVDRVGFSQQVERCLREHPNIIIERKEITFLPDSPCILATGPLTSDPLSQDLKKFTGMEYLAFFDAIAPIVLKDSIDFNIAWMQSRYDKGGSDDYINCPMNKEQYYSFIEELLGGEKTSVKEWEKNTPYFNGCLPIEVMAERGKETLRFGPMKPVGLTNPHSPDKPYAVVQLRQDNALGTIYNMVGFQTKLKYGEQQKILRMIPGLENAEFVRMGGLHRNTFINSPKLLDVSLKLKAKPNIRIAGQITGVEGYLESAAMGLLAGIFTAFDIKGAEIPMLPVESAFGALLTHITSGANSETFQPMNINFGLFPDITVINRNDKKQMLSLRAQASLNAWKVCHYGKIFN